MTAMSSYHTIPRDVDEVDPFWGIQRILRVLSTWIMLNKTQKTSDSYAMVDENNDKSSEGATCLPTCTLAPSSATAPAPAVAGETVIVSNVLAAPVTKGAWVRGPPPYPAGTPKAQ
ncbi:similar to An12g02310 [Aspergillus luchuensis]|uniref:Similar to An12g02310 n=1 Tax=Aspergillus kawachii TaxID=1069201 RepID=A0A146FHY5_ASPKA|nr:similar to An12g02310 [Aspergillus luchuensis]